MTSNIFKSLNNINPLFMKNLFNKKSDITEEKNKLTIHTKNYVTFANNILRFLGPHIWNTLPENIKEITCFEKFKKPINNW